jgi:uncharacterized protein with HEPN domain
VPPRDSRLFVVDIIDAIETIDGFIAGMARQEFFADRLRPGELHESVST